MKKISGLQFDSKNGGKYSDVSFLVELISAGPILWISEPLIKYRIHSTNDSANVSFVDLIKISLFFVRNSPTLIFYILIYLIKNSIKKCLQFVI